MKNMFNCLFCASLCIYIFIVRGSCCFVRLLTTTSFSVCRKNLFYCSLSYLSYVSEVYIVYVPLLNYVSVFITLDLSHHS